MLHPGDTRPRLPRCPRPICIIGAGGIVRDAHLPAYEKAGFQVFGLADRDGDRAGKLASVKGIPLFADSAEALVAKAPREAVFDLAVPADQHASVLSCLPRGAAVLIQKPMGETLDEAREILEICRQRQLRAAVNFQLRFAPYVMAAHALISRGVIGELRDIEFRVTAHTPWELFPFLRHKPRLEIAYHSIHYIDCMRHFLGDPRSIRAQSLKDPGQEELAELRTSILMDYGDTVRATILMNHGHAFGPRHQQSYIKWEGVSGAIYAKMGLLMNYPHGVPDEFEVCTLDGEEPDWKSFDLEGTWFPDAFIGSMAQVMRAADGEADALVTPVEDAFRTMACMEAAYVSNASGGIEPDFNPEPKN